MSQIDPASISRILRTLSAPGSSVESKAHTGVAAFKEKGAPARSSPAVLKSRIQNRLASLDEEERRHVGPLITVQEVLRWEFGDEVLDSTGFASVTEKVAGAMLEDAQLAAAMQRLVDQLSSKK